MKVIQFNIDDYQTLTYITRALIQKDIVFSVQWELHFPCVEGDSLLAFYKWAQKHKIRSAMEKGTRKVNICVFYAYAVPPVVRKIEALLASRYFCHGKCTLKLEGDENNIVRHGQLCFVTESNKA